MITKPADFNAALCAVLGIDPHKTRVVAILCEANKPPVVHVEQFITTDETAELSAVLSEYNLVRRDG